MPAREQGTILVVGGGIAGITAAVELAEVGLNVVLLEREPFLRHIGIYAYSRSALEDWVALSPSPLERLEPEHESA